MLAIQVLKSYARQPLSAQCLRGKWDDAIPMGFHTERYFDRHVCMDRPGDPGRTPLDANSADV